MKKFSVVLMILILMGTIIVPTSAKTLNEINNEIKTVETKLLSISIIKKETHELAETYRKHGKSDNSKEIKNLKNNWDILNKEEQNLKNILINLKEEKKIEESEPKYNEEDLYVLSHVINGEAGSNWCSDLNQLCVGNVVLNRVKSSKYPNTITKVVFQSGQYACTWDGNYYKTPTERAIRNAKRLLNGERFCPDNVVYQAGFKQGTGLWKQIQGHYFCYGNV